MATIKRDEAGVPLPLIHLNGSGRTALVNQQLALLDALQVALEAAAQAAPHERDYYPLAELGGPTPYAEARRAHETAMATLRALYARVEDRARLIDNEGV